MAGKKDNAVVTVITNLTDTQAANITADIQKAKSKRAPESRGTIAKSKQKNIRKILEKSTLRIDHEKK
jgi:hypothetical protein